MGLKEIKQKISEKLSKNNEGIMPKSGMDEIRLLDYLRLSQNKLAAYEFAGIIDDGISTWGIDRMGRNSQTLDEIVSVYYPGNDTIVKFEDEYKPLNNVVVSNSDRYSGSIYEKTFDNVVDYIRYRQNDEGGFIGKMIADTVGAIVIDASGYCNNRTCNIYCSDLTSKNLLTKLQGLYDQVQQFNAEVAEQSNGKITYGDLLNKFLIKFSIISTTTGKNYSTPEEFIQDIQAKNNETEIVDPYVETGSSMRR